MGNTSLIRTALLVALLIAFGFAATGRAPAAEPPAAAGDPRAQVIQVVGSDASSQFVPLGVGKSVVIDLPRDIKDVLVARSHDRQCGRSARRAAPTSSASRSARPTSTSSTPTASRSPASTSR